MKYEDGEDATRLYPLKRDVQAANMRKLTALPSKLYNFRCADTSGIRDEEPHAPFYPDAKRLGECLDKNTLVERDLPLKIGAQVMLVKVKHQVREA